MVKNQQNISIYTCPGFTQAFKNKIKAFNSNPIESQPFQEIEKNIFITGEMKGIYKESFIPEQALILKTEKGLVIITGCAHPGITDIVKIVEEHFPQDNIYLVLGGFHLRAASETEIETIVKGFQVLAVKKVSPLHCSGNKEKEIFKKHYGNNFIDLRVGEILEI